MLYDNSQLVSLYVAAYKHTKNENYKTIITETLDFIQRELTSEDGGFYASLDADSDGEEGKYYVWSQQEIQQILGDDAKLILDYYNIEANGNWENGINILFKTETDTTIAERYKYSVNELKTLVSKAKKQLQRLLQPYQIHLNPFCKGPWFHHHLDTSIHWDLQYF